MNKYFAIVAVIIGIFTASIFSVATIAETPTDDKTELQKIREQAIRDLEANAKAVFEPITADLREIPAELDNLLCNYLYLDSTNDVHILNSNKGVIIRMDSDLQTVISSMEYEPLDSCAVDFFYDQEADHYMVTYPDGFTVVSADGYKNYDNDESVSSWIIYGSNYLFSGLNGFYDLVKLQSSNGSSEVIINGNDFPLPDLSSVGRFQTEFLSSNFKLALSESTLLLYHYWLSSILEYDLEKKEVVTIHRIRELDAAADFNVYNDRKSFQTVIKSAGMTGQYIWAHIKSNHGDYIWIKDSSGDVSLLDLSGEDIGQLNASVLIEDEGLVVISTDLDSSRRPFLARRVFKRP